MKFSVLGKKIELLILLSLLLLTGCKDDHENTGTAHDPSKPVEITGFSPKKGGARTRLYIEGKNFGSNVNDIYVTIGGKAAKVIGSNGEFIYCMVPFKASEGTIEVKVGNNGTPVVAKEKFEYQSRTIVGTVAGYVDETGKVEVKDGTFEEAGFSGPGWITVDPKDKNKFYLTDGNEWSGSAIRLLDINERTVSTLLTKGEGNWESIRSCAFTMTGDTMLVVNQTAADGAVGISYVTRANGFKKPQPLIREKTVCTVAVHPNGELYYNNRNTGLFYRYDIKSQTKVSIGTVGRKGDANFIFIHPTGNYAYVVNGQGKVIYKLEYDWVNKTLKNANVICGVLGKEGWLDGQGTNAILGNPMEGVFVKNEQYVRDNKEDHYDFYFADGTSHSIRYLTPEGFVHTYAGRGSQGVNNNPYGYVDGDLRQEARFNYPLGLHYDEENKIFYIGDTRNKRVRNIQKDE